MLGHLAAVSCYSVRVSKVVVVGASGFVGRQVCEALEARGVEVVRCKAPRLEAVEVAGGSAILAAHTADYELDPAFTAQLRGADALVNAAGDPDASSRDDAALFAANAALPGLLGRYAVAAGIERFVHVSSAVVQGRLPVLDASDTFDAFSAYAASKVVGERLAREFGLAQTVCYRPPSVHHESRRVTQLTARIASSALSSVASPGSQHTPQALAQNVGSAVAELAVCEAQPPAVVIHPWEGLSCLGLLEVLGGRTPRRLPRFIARALVATLELAGKLVPRLAANARRIEMVWFGQGQAESWLTQQGWQPPVGLEGWVELRERLVRTQQP